MDKLEVVAAQATGIEPGDTIIAVNGKLIGQSQEAYCIARQHLKDSVQMQIMSRGDTLSVLFTAQDLSNLLSMQLPRIFSSLTTALNFSNNIFSFG